LVTLLEVVRFTSKQWSLIQSALTFVLFTLRFSSLSKSDHNCLSMVSNNLHKDILSILEEKCASEDDICFQHACLSTLRNLSIPAANKAKICKTEIISVLIRTSVSETHAVTFKLVGTLRMLTDHNVTVAKQLGNHKAFLNRVVGWCKAIHPGLKNESSRLLTRIVKIAKDSNIVSLVVQLSGVEPIVAMLSCEHLVMQNDALLAIIVMLSFYNKLIEEALIDSDLGQHLHIFFNQSVNEDCLPIEILINALTLIDLSVSKSAKLLEHLTINCIKSDVKDISLNNYPSLAPKVTDILSLF